MLTAGAKSPVSPSGTVLARLRLSSRACTPSAPTPPTASGYAHWMSMFEDPSAFCMATSWSGSAKTPPTQYSIGGIIDTMRLGRPTVLSLAQKDEVAPRIRTIAVMTILT